MGLRAWSLSLETRISEFRGKRYAADQITQSQSCSRKLASLRKMVSENRVRRPRGIEVNGAIAVAKVVSRLCQALQRDAVLA